MNTSGVRNTTYVCLLVFVFGKSFQRTKTEQNKLTYKLDYSYSNIMGQILLLLPAVLQASEMVKSDDKQRQ